MHIQNNGHGEAEDEHRKRCRVNQVGGKIEAGQLLNEKLYVRIGRDGIAERFTHLPVPVRAETEPPTVFDPQYKP